MRWARSKLTRIGVVVTATLGIVVVLAGVAYGVLNTRLGKAWLADTLLPSVLTVAGQRFAVAEVGGRLPSHLRLFGLSVQDATGIWLTIEEAEIKWRPWQLFGRTLDIELLSVRGVHIARRPVNGVRGKDEDRVVPRLPIGVVVGAYEFDDVVIDPSIAGQRVALRAEGFLSLGANDDVRIAMEAKRTDDVPASIDTSFLYEADTGTLTVNVTASEPQGGVIAQLLQLPGSPSLRILAEGSGPLENWDGTVSANAGTDATLDAHISVRRPDSYALVAVGKATLPTVWRKPAPALLAPPLEFEINTKVGDYGQIDVSHISLQNNAFTLELEGNFDLEREAVDLNFAVTPADKSAFTEVITPVRVKKFAIDGRVKGKLTAPTVTAHLGAEEVSFHRTRAVGASTKIEVLVGQEPGRLTWTASGQADQLTLDDRTPDVSGIGPVAWRLNGAFTPTDRRFDVEHVEVSSEMGWVNATGTVSLDKTNEQAFRFGVSGELLRAPFEHAVLSKVLEKPVDIKGEVVGHRDTGLVQILSATFDHPLAAVRANADINTLSATISARYQLKVPDLDALTGPAGIPVHGTNLALYGTAVGSISDPELAADLSASTLASGQFSVSNLLGQARLESAVSKPSGTIALNFLGPVGTTTVSSDVVWNRSRDRVELDQFVVVAENNWLSGTMSIPLKGALIEGKLSGELGSLEEWSTVAGTPLSGSLSFSAQLNAEAGRQAISVEATGTGVSVSFPAVGIAGAADLTLTGRTRPMEDRAVLGFEVQAHHATVGAAQLDRLTVSGTTDGRRTDFAAETSGILRDPLKAALSGHLVLDPDGFSLTLARLDATAGGTKLALEQSTEIIRSGRAFTVPPTIIRIDNGTLEASAIAGGNDLSAELKAIDAPLKILQLAWPRVVIDGKASGIVSISASGRDAQAQVSLDLVNVVPREVSDRISPHSGALRSQWRGKRLAVSLDLADGKGSLVSFTGDAPLTYDPSATRFAIPEDEPVSGLLEWRAELAPLWDTFGGDIHRLTGDTDAEFVLAGTVAAPRVTGHLRVANGSYKNLELGTLGENIDLVIEASQTRLVLQRATATDGNSGTISATGWIDVDPARRFPVQLDVTVKDAVVLRRSDVSATASGNITFERKQGRAHLKGLVETSQIEVRLMRTLPADVVELDVIEVGGPAKIAVTPEPASSEGGPPPTFLDIEVVVPRKAYIRGRGLDSEWAGGLHVGGTMAELEIAGSIEVVRGQFDLAGRAFNLTSGQVTFEGGPRIDPILDVAAEYRARNLLATAKISGPITAPKISFSSEPELPEDEIMARVLFGTGVAQLSPFQALQLANALRTLTSPKDGAAGLLGVTRSALGLDVLRVGAAQDGASGPTITGGKYLTDNINVEVEVGAQTGQGKVTVEVEVTPHLSVESDVSPESGGGAGVIWRWDY